MQLILTDGFAAGCGISSLKAWSEKSSCNVPGSAYISHSNRGIIKAVVSNICRFARCLLRHWRGPPPWAIHDDSTYFVVNVATEEDFESSDEMRKYSSRELFNRAIIVKSCIPRFGIHIDNCWVSNHGLSPRYDLILVLRIDTVRCLEICPSHLIETINPTDLIWWCKSRERSLAEL
jgi:hypothetical protein